MFSCLFVDYYKRNNKKWDKREKSCIVDARHACSKIPAHMKCLKRSHDFAVFFLSFTCSTPPARVSVYKYGSLFFICDKNICDVKVFRQLLHNKWLVRSNNQSNYQSDRTESVFDHVIHSCVEQWSGWHFTCSYDA